MIRVGNTSRKWQVVKRWVCKGIPYYLPSLVWQLVLGSCDLLFINQGVYKVLVFCRLSALLGNCINSSIDSFGSDIYPKTSYELNYTSKGFSCNFSDLTMSQSPQGFSNDIFDKWY
jgi:hypothetical protein